MDLTVEQIEARLTDLDYAVLSILPDEGSKLGYHTLGKQVRHISQALDGTDGNLIGGRLRTMRQMRMVTDVTMQPTSSGRGWQVTPLGKDILARHMDDIRPSMPEPSRVERERDAEAGPGSGGPEAASETPEQEG